MKLISFTVSGRSSWGVATDAGVIDMGRRLDGKFPTLRSLLASRDCAT